MTLRIKDWDNFQHYRDRRPPWIKLYRSLLEDVEFLKLCGDTDLGILIRLWLIASEDKKMNGNLPDIETLAVRLHMAFPGRVTKREIAKVEKALTSLNHWLVRDASNIASAGLSEVEQNAIPETETETEKSRDIQYSVGGDGKSAAEETAEQFLAVFNAVFERRCGITKIVGSKIQGRLKGGLYQPWQIVIAPILQSAQDHNVGRLRNFGPDTLLRDGSHPRTGSDGRTYGGTDWLERIFSAADTLRLDGRLTQIAEHFGLVDDITRTGAQITETQI